MAADHSPAHLTSDRAWRQRLGQLRHDLVNPLGEILGFAEMLLEENNTQHPAIADSLQHILAAGRRVLNELNRSLHPDTLRADPSRLAAASDSIRAQLDEISATADHLASMAAGPEHDDLARIASAAQRLRALQATTFATVAGLPPPLSVEPAAGGETQAPFLRATPPPPAPATTPAGPAARGSILVVDDQEPNRALLDRRLRRRGYEVTLAEHGRAALEALRTRHFDLVLLDIMMPEIDGVEVLRRLKAEPRTAHIPVLMLSAFDDFDAVVNCVELGAVDYLPKPFPAPLLHARVEACLANKRMSDQLRLYAEWLFGPKLVTEAVNAPASLGLTRHERTVIFADIRGFTAWSERRAPEEIVQLLNGYFEAAERLWAGSSVIKTEYTGDEIMAVFPNAADALRLAHTLREHLGARLAPFGLSLGIGVHSGSVIEGLVGGAGVKAYRFVGDTVNTAKRICTEAVGGQVLLSDVTRHMVGTIIVADSALELTMKGKSERMRVWPLIALTAPSASAHPAGGKS